MKNRKGVEVAAVAQIVGDEAKFAAYTSRLPKRDRRELSRASPETRIVIEAMSEWYAFYQEGATGLGLPTETTLHRAGLMIPRAPLTNALPPMAEPPARAAAVESIMPTIQPVDRRALIGVERYGGGGMESVARRLGMRFSELRSRVAKGRAAVASGLRALGWEVPHDD